MERHQRATRLGRPPKQEARNTRERILDAALERFAAQGYAAASLRHGYSGQIFERHHATKKDAPSGTALTIQRIVREASGPGADKKDDLEITSFREGEVVGLHEVVLESANDRIYLCHDAKSRRGFAEGAVLAAEWIAGKKGFYDFKDIWREL